MRLGRLYCVGPRGRAAKINAVNTTPAVDRRRSPRSPEGLRVKGHRGLPELTVAIRRELNPTPTEEAAAARAA
jgi:hypothetical protein